MKKCLLLVLAFLLGVFVTATTLSFAKMKFSKEEIAQRIVNRVTTELSLNTAQQQTLNEIKESVLLKISQSGPQRKTNLQKFAEEFAKEKMDLSFVDEIVAEKISQSNEQKEFLKQNLTKFHNTLTPEQRQKVAEKIKERLD